MEEKVPQYPGLFYFLLFWHTGWRVRLFPCNNSYKHRAPLSVMECSSLRSWLLLPLLLWWPGYVGVVVQVCRTRAHTSNSGQLLLESLQLDAGFVSVQQGVNQRGLVTGQDVGLKTQMSTDT